MPAPLYYSPPRLPLLMGLLLSVGWLTQCQSEALEALPPESTSGANTAGCLVDGQVLVPREKWGRAGLSLGFRLSTVAKDASFSLDLSDEQDVSKPFLQLRADSLVLVAGQSYPFSASAHRGVVQGSCLLSDGGSYRTTVPTSGTLTITRLDRQAQLLAGRFEFVGTNPATGKQVRITQGRFDFQVH